MGSVRIKVSKHPRYTHEVLWQSGGKRMREFVKGAARARVRAAEMEEELAGMLADDAPLSKEEWAAVRLVRAMGKGLGEVVEEWEGLTKAAAAAAAVQTVTVAELMAARVKSLARSGLDPYYQRAIARAAKRAAAGLGSVPAGEVTAARVRGLLEEGKVSVATMNARRVLLHGIFEWGREQGLLPKNPLAGMRVLQEDRAALAETEVVTVLTPAEARALLAGCVVQAPGMLPYVAIGMFAGLRTAELQRLRWEDVKTERGFIEVRKSVAKTRSRRLVDLQPALVTILEQVPRGEGLVCPPNARKLLDRARAVAGWDEGRPWAKNALRDSFTSYHLALYRNAGETALQSGHSETVLFRHYREVVTPEDAAEFWQLAMELAAEDGPGWSEWLALHAKEVAERRSHKDRHTNYPENSKRWAGRKYKPRKKGKKIPARRVEPGGDGGGSES